MRWARRLEGERAWAIEDCRNVSGKLERFLIARGEKVVRVPPKLMAGRRRSSRERGKSDPIDALAIARAALEEGIDNLPLATLRGPEREIKLLLDHREDLVGERTRFQHRLRWLLHDRWPELELAGGTLARKRTSERLSRRLGRLAQDAEIRVMRSQLRRVRELTREIEALERQIASLVEQQQPRLLAIVGIGTLGAAKLITEIAGVARFASEAKLARCAGLAPIPASSGATHRHRLDRGGNRQLNAAFYRIAVTQLRCHAPARAYYERQLASGKSRREAIRCLKRQLVRPIFKAMQPA